MNTPLKDNTIDTRPLLDIFLHAGSSPAVAVRLPDVVDITTGLRAGSEQPWKDSSAMYFRTDYKDLYITDASGPGGYTRIGRLTANVNEAASIGGAWWFVCDAELDAAYRTERFLEKYLRFDSMDFSFTLYGEFISKSGRNSGHDWSAVLLMPWTDIDLNDPSRLVSPASSLHPFLLRFRQQDEALPAGSLYVFKGLATQPRMPVFVLGRQAGLAEGFRLVRAGIHECFCFMLYEYDKSLIPEHFWWNNCLVVTGNRVTAAASRGSFITRMDVDLPPPAFLAAL